jgi:hypothetical protein
MIAWRPPGFNGGAPLTAYAVTTYRDGTAVDRKTLDDGTTSTAVTGLEEGHSYQFTVAATNLVGTGPESAPAVVPTQVGDNAGRVWLRTF